MATTTTSSRPTLTGDGITLTLNPEHCELEAWRED